MEEEEEGGSAAEKKNEAIRGVCQRRLRRLADREKSRFRPGSGGFVGGEGWKEHVVSGFTLFIWPRRRREDAKPLRHRPSLPPPAVTCIFNVCGTVKRTFTIERLLINCSEFNPFI